MLKNIHSVYNYLNPRTLFNSYSVFKDDDKILKDIDEQVKKMEESFDSIISLISSSNIRKIHLDMIFDINTVDNVNVKKFATSSDIVVYLDCTQKNQTMVKKSDHYMDNDECILFPTNPSNSSIIHVNGASPYCWTKSYIQLKPKNDGFYIPFIIYLLNKRISTIPYVCDYDARFGIVTTTVSVEELKKIDILNIRKDDQLRICNIYDSVKSLNYMAVDLHVIWGNT